MIKVSRRLRPTLYGMMYGAGPRRSWIVFLANKQNRRMPARLRKKLFNKLKADFDAFCELAWAKPEAVFEPKLEVKIELSSKR